jgi:hypothetical protein
MSNSKLHLHACMQVNNTINIDAKRPVIYVRKRVIV